jgi:FkbM family methyltransferase
MDLFKKSVKFKKTGTMENTSINKKYIKLLGIEQAEKLQALFLEIEKGKYDKKEIHTFKLTNLIYPIHIRAIRADMQSFVNTFVEPFLEKKPYMNDVKNVIDAGANIGYTAVLFANWWPGAKIISVEPDKENYEFTIKNTACYPNIAVLNNALWNKETELMIEAGQEDGFVVREIKNLMVARSENITTGISIKQIMEEHSMRHIDFLKMNIEGSGKIMKTGCRPQRLCLLNCTTGKMRDAQERFFVK